VQAPPPDLDTCRALDYGAISHYTNDDPTVPCTAAHTAYTFAIETLPDDVRVAGVSIGNKAIQHAASDACRTAFDGYIGGDAATRALSRLSVTYFLPPQDGFNAGAHWIRCDVVALKTPSSLATLPAGSLQGFLDKPTAQRDYGVCTQGVPGGPDATLVMCSQQHLYRAVTTLRLGDDNAAYPGPSVTAKQGQQRCADYLRNKLGEATGYTFGWTYPTASDWASGQRFGYCWLKNHH
jgi:hypothetical protein